MADRKPRVAKYDEEEFAPDEAEGVTSVGDTLTEQEQSALDYLTSREVVEDENGMRSLQPVGGASPVEPNELTERLTEELGSLLTDQEVSLAGEFISTIRENENPGGVAFVYREHPDSYQLSVLKGDRVVLPKDGEPRDLLAEMKQAGGVYAEAAEAYEASQQQLIEGEPVSDIPADEAPDLTGQREGAASQGEISLDIPIDAEELASWSADEWERAADTIRLIRQQPEATTVAEMRAEMPTLPDEFKGLTLWGAAQALDDLVGRLRYHLDAIGTADAAVIAKAEKYATYLRYLDPVDASLEDRIAVADFREREVHGDYAPDEDDEA